MLAIKYLWLCFMDGLTKHREAIQRRELRHLARDLTIRFPYCERMRAAPGFAYWRFARGNIRGCIRRLDDCGKFCDRVSALTDQGHTVFVARWGVYRLQAGLRGLNPTLKIEYNDDRLFHSGKEVGCLVIFHPGDGQETEINQGLIILNPGFSGIIPANNN